MSAPYRTETPGTLPNVPPHPHPKSLRDLFWAFTWLALQGFGGVLAVVQRELVDKRRWLTREQFVEDWAVAQVLPGPNVVNLCLMIGDRYFGIRGGLAALAGMLTFPLLIVLILAWMVTGYADSTPLQGALRGMGAVSAGMITATGIKLWPALKSNVLGTTICMVIAASTFIAIALLRIPLIWVLAGLGGCACVWVNVLLSRTETKVDAS
jgi:chromate transporter